MSNFSTVSVSQTGVGVSNPILFKNPTAAFRALFNVYVTGTVTYDIEYSIDPSASPQYVKLETLDRTASSDDAMYFPVSAVRVNVTSGDGTAKLVALYQQ